MTSPPTDYLGAEAIVAAWHAGLAAASRAVLLPRLSNAGPVPERERESGFEGLSLSALVARHPLPEGVETAEMSQEDVAAALSVSVNTVAKWIKLGMPVVEPGGQGRAYVLDLAECWAWKAERDAQDAARDGAAKKAVQDMQASFLGLEGGQSDGLSPLQRRQLAEADMVQSRAAQLRRQLVPLEEVREMLDDIFGIIREGVESLPDRLERVLDLDADEVELVTDTGRGLLGDMADRIAEAQLEEREIEDALEIAASATSGAGLV